MISTKYQAPTSREISSTKLQNGQMPRLVIEGWNFSGTWMLVFGIFAA
jgi:hypothetical protein